MATERSINVRVRLNGTDKFKKDMQGVTGSLSDMGGWLDVTKGILASDVIRQGLNAIANAIGESIDKSIEFETSMAGVQKTTGMTDAQLQAMANNLMDMSERIPMTATKLANLAEIAGQLGIADKDIEEFIEVVAAMGVSTNLSADQAATSLARMANIMGTSAQDYERVGSVVVELGNNMATTESEIIDMAQRMAGVGSLVGMNEADVMAYAAALSSVGIEEEAGSTAISTLWTEMEIMTATGSDELEKFAQIAGMTSSEFANLWDTDSAGAFSKFISGLQQMGIEGESVMAILGELGVTNVRERKAITSLAGANDVLTESLAMAREEWKNNTALADEAGTYYETSASRIEMAQSKLENLQIAPGKLTFLKNAAFAAIAIKSKKQSKTA